MSIKHSSILNYDGENFVREYTTLTLENGQPATGTLLDRDMAAHKALSNKQFFSGTVNLFGQELNVNYAPRLSADGELIGALMVAL